MSFNTYGLYRRTFGIFTALCIFSYFLFHFNNYLLFDGELSAYAALYDTLEYVRYVISDLISFIIPTVSAVLLAPLTFERRAHKLYPTALLLALPHIFYNIPYYYVYHIAYHYDSIESILISIPLSILISLFTALYTLALAYVSRYVFLRRGGEPHSYSARAVYFSLSHSLSASIFSIVFIHFAINFINELIDAITFFIEYADSYRIGELIYILGRFVLILVLMLFAQWLCTFIHNKVVSGRFSDDDSNQTESGEKKAE